MKQQAIKGGFTGKVQLQVTRCIQHRPSLGKIQAVVTQKSHNLAPVPAKIGNMRFCHANYVP